MKMQALDKKFNKNNERVGLKELCQTTKQTETMHRSEVNMNYNITST